MAEQIFEQAAHPSEEEIALFEQNVEPIVAEIEPVAMEARANAVTVEIAEVAAAYKVVDLRGKFTSRKGSWGVSKKTLGNIDHYNGPPVPASAWANPIAWIKMINDLHAQTGRFSPGWKFDGIAYHEFIIGDTVYLLRDEDAKLPHCGNTKYNAGAIALHIPVGTGQTPSDLTYRTFFARVTEHLRKQGLGRSSTYPHSAVGSSECPGDTIRAAIARYVSGQNPGGSPTPVKEQPYRIRKYNFLHALPEHREIAKAATEAINAALVKAGKKKLATYAGSTPEKVAFATRESAEGNFGEVVSILVGEPVTHYVHPAVSVVGAPDETDIWGSYKVYPNLGSADAVGGFLAQIVSREKLPAPPLMADYRRRLGKAQAR